MLLAIFVSQVGNVALASLSDEILHVGAAIRASEKDNQGAYIGFPSFLAHANGTTRAWNLGGGLTNPVAGSQTLAGIPLAGSAGGYPDLAITGAVPTAKTILNWAGDPQRLAKNNISNTALHITGATKSSWAVNIPATPGITYDVEVLSNMETGGIWRNFDVDVDGVKFADNLFVPAGVTSGGGPPDSYSTVYKFPVTADADGIDIVFSRGFTTYIAGSGGSVELQTRPYVTALAVTAASVPESSTFITFAFLAATSASFSEFARRRRA